MVQALSLTAGPLLLKDVTLLGAIGTYLLRRHEKLAAAPPILANLLIIPFVLKWAYGVSEALPYLFLTIGLGEVISCGVLGMILLYALKPHAKALFPQSEPKLKKRLAKASFLYIL